MKEKWVRIGVGPWGLNGPLLKKLYQLSFLYPLLPMELLFTSENGLPN